MNEVKLKTKVKSAGCFQTQFIELMSDENIQLPLREDEDYENTLRELFDYYCLKISDFMTEKQVKSIRIICDTILKMVNEYNDEAYATFERLMEYRLFSHNLHIIQETLPIDGYGRTNMNLFRLRSVYENKKYKRKDIFHDPKTKGSDKRRKPYRYSLEDRPSLYLSSTVYCCHKEMGIGSNMQNMIGSLFRINPQVKQDLFIIDIANRPIDYVKNSNKYKRANIGYTESAYLFVYPFIAACSVVVPSKENRNIEEYKITNMLYKWLVKHHGHQLCGIRYFSCHDSFYSITDKNDDLNFERDSRTSFTKYFVNYVFPVGREVDSHGYCCQLKKTFLVSYPKYIREYKNIQEFERDIKRSSTLLVIDEKHKERSKG